MDSHQAVEIFRRRQRMEIQTGLRTTRRKPANRSVIIELHAELRHPIDYLPSCSFRIDLVDELLRQRVDIIPLLLR